MLPTRPTPTYLRSGPTANDATADLLALAELGGGRAVESHFRLGPNELCEPLPRCPVRHLPEGDSGAAWVESLQVDICSGVEQ